MEGALIRFALRGPLHWLRAVDLADPSAGTNLLVSLSRWGAGWLGHDVPQPEENVHPRLTVAEDFTVTVAPDVPLGDRFRVERFAEWQSSYPNYVYRITQRTLKRAADTGISAGQIADFLKSRGRQTPPRDRCARAVCRCSPYPEIGLTSCTVASKILPSLAPAPDTVLFSQSLLHQRSSTRSAT